MATPMLRAVRRHFARPAHLVGVVRPNLSEVLDGTPWLDEQWYFDPRADQCELRHTSLIRRMRRERFEMAILLTNSLRTALIAWLGGTRQRIGYVRYGRGPLLTDKLYPRRQAGRLVPEPMVDYYLALAAAAGCPPESPRLELSSTQAEDRLAERIWRELGLRTDGRVVTFNCSGAYGAAKLWPTEYFGGLARRVVDEMNHDVLIVCGSQERQDRPGNCRPCPPGPRFLHGRADPGTRRQQGLHPAGTPDGLDRQRAPAHRRGLRSAGDHALRSHAADLDREPHGAGGQPPARSVLHRLLQARLPTGTSSLHEGPLRRPGRKRGGRAAPGGTGLSRPPRYSSRSA